MKTINQIYYSIIIICVSICLNFFIQNYKSKKNKDLEILIWEHGYNTGLLNNKTNSKERWDLFKKDSLEFTLILKN